MSVGFNTGPMQLIHVGMPQSIDNSLTCDTTELTKAEEIFKTCSLDSRTKEQIIEHLSSAYRSLQGMRKNHEYIPIGLESIASRIFYLYGKCLYSKNMHASRRMFELSLTTQLVGLKVFGSSILPQLSQALEDTPKYAEITESTSLFSYIESRSEEEIVRTVQAEDKDSAFNFAASLRWMGATYQGNGRCNTELYAPFYEKIYGCAGKIWEGIALQGDLQCEKDCHWEIAQMIYHTSRFRHNLKNPNDIMGALETLKDIEPYLTVERNSLRAQELRAEIHHTKATHLAGLPAVNLKLCYDETAEAEAIAASTSEFNPFLKTMYLRNKASQALNCLKAGILVADIQEIRCWFGKVLFDIAQEKYNHSDHAFFLIDAAKFEIHDQQLEAAEKLLNKAEEVAKKYPHISTNAKKAIEEQRYCLALDAAQTALAKAEEIFRTYPLDSQKAKKIIEHLSSAYLWLQGMRKNHEIIPNGLENIASRIFYLYGKCLYSKNIYASRRMFELALTTQFVDLKVFDSSVLPQLSGVLEDTLKYANIKEFTSMLSYIESTSEEEIVLIAQTQGKDNAFNFADTLRWMGATYQDDNRYNTPTYLPFYEKVYGCAGKIWDAIALQDDLQWKKDCHWEIAQMIYHTSRFRHNIMGALETLKDIEPYLTAEENSLRAQELRAEIHHIKASHLAGRPKLCYDETAIAEAIAASTSEFNPFLKTMYLRNKASQALNCLKAGILVADIQEIRSWFGTVLFDIAQENYNHSDHAFFLIDAAKFEIHDQQLEAAEKLLNQAEEVAKKYPHISKNAKNAIEEQRSYLALPAAETALAKAEEIFKTCSMDSQVTKEKMVQHLNSAYRSLQAMRKSHEIIPNGVENIASRIFYLFGKCLYSENIYASRRMFELSLTTQLVGLKVLDSSVLPQLSQVLEDTPKYADIKLFTSTVAYIESTSEEEIVQTVQTMDKDNAFNFAASLRWMGATFQVDKRCNTHIYVPFYEKVYGCAHKIWDAIALEGDLQWKKDCHWEIAQMIYHTAPFRHSLQKPDDNMGALETLKDIEPYLTAEGNSLRAQELRTKINEKLRLGIV